MKEYEEKLCYEQINNGLPETKKRIRMIDRKINEINKNEEHISYI